LRFAVRPGSSRQGCRSRRSIISWRFAQNGKPRNSTEVTTMHSPLQALKQPQTQDETAEEPKPPQLKTKTDRCKAIGLGHAQTLALMHQQSKSAAKQRSCLYIHNNVQPGISYESCQRGAKGGASGETGRAQRAKANPGAETAGGEREGRQIKCADSITYNFQCRLRCFLPHPFDAPLNIIHNSTTSNSLPQLAQLPQHSPILFSLSASAYSSR